MTLRPPELAGQPVRVAFVIGSLAVGGAETQLVRLASGLDRRRFKPSIVCLWQGGGLEGAVATDVPVIKALVRPMARFRQSRIVMGLRIFAALIRELRRQRPDIVHAYLPAAYVPASIVAWFLRVPLIVAGRRGLTSIEIYGAFRWRLMAQMANRVIDVQICNSGAVRDYSLARERLKADRMRVVYNGIDLPPLTPQNLPREWTSPDGQVAIVANFIRYKGHRELLQAVARVKQRHPSFVLVMIGDGPERASLADLTRSLGIVDNVVFAGTRRNAGQLLQAFDFTILGSSQEGFPNALMESMASAVPVVSTAVGGVPELVEDGVHGRLVPFGDIDAMADAVNWMIEHPVERRQMGELGRQRIASAFSTERMVSETEAVYEEFLAARKVAPVTQ